MFVILFLLLNHKEAAKLMRLTTELFAKCVLGHLSACGLFKSITVLNFGVLIPKTYFYTTFIKFYCEDGAIFDAVMAFAFLY